METYRKDDIEKECEVYYSNYYNQSLPDPGRGHKWSGELVDCIFDKLNEMAKANMAVTAILLALVPAGLLSFGPSIAELSILSTRRPLLAALLGFGLMSPNPTTEFDFEELVQKSSRNRVTFPGLGSIRRERTAVKILVSFVEYAIAAGATANCFYQIWRFTYRAISIAPIAVYIDGIPETATLFGYGFLNLPIHILGFVTFALAFRHLPAPQGGNDGKKKRPGVLQYVLDELTPCAHGRMLHLEVKEKSKPWRNIVATLTRLIAGLHIVLGTVLIGSVVFVYMGDALPVIYGFVAAAVFTRAVLIYELRSLAEKTTLQTADVYEEDPSMPETEVLRPKVAGD